MKNFAKSNSYSVGKLAETLAILLLTLKLYRIISRRYKTRLGEIDIIALRGKTLIFVEVKKRANKEELFESISNKQKKRLINAAELFLVRNNIYTNCIKRFDAIFIPRNFIPVHIKNVWGK